MKQPARLSLLAIIVLLIVAVWSAPLAAQSQDAEDLIFLTGTIDLSQGVIGVSGYQLVPGTAPLPSPLRQGDYVIVIGYLQSDGVTVIIESLDVVADPDAPPTPEPTPQVTPIVTVEPTIEVTQDVTAEPTDCTREGHPVATRYAEAFEVTYDEIIAWHCEGFGFGEIARAYLLAEATGEEVQSYFDARSGGQGWGQIMRDSDVHPSDLAPGRVGRGNRDEAEGDDDAASAEQRGNGNGNGGGNGNDGNGNGNGNGRGNGNGGGNGNGNGRGNG